MCQTWASTRDKMDFLKELTVKQKHTDKQPTLT